MAGGPGQSAFQARGLEPRAAAGRVETTPRASRAKVGRTARFRSRLAWRRTSALNEVVGDGVRPGNPTGRSAGGRADGAAIRRSDGLNAAGSSPVPTPLHRPHRRPSGAVPPGPNDVRPAATRPPRLCGVPHPDRRVLPGSQQLSTVRLNRVCTPPGVAELRPDARPAPPSVPAAGRLETTTRRPSEANSTAVDRVTVGRRAAGRWVPVARSQRWTSRPDRHHQVPSGLAGPGVAVPVVDRRPAGAASTCSRRSSGCGLDLALPDRRQANQCMVMSNTAYPGDAICLLAVVGPGGRFDFVPDPHHPVGGRPTGPVVGDQPVPVSGTPTGWAGPTAQSTRRPRPPARVCTTRPPGRGAEAGRVNVGSRWPRQPSAPARRSGRPRRRARGGHGCGRQRTARPG